MKKLFLILVLLFAFQTHAQESDIQLNKNDLLHNAAEGALVGGASYLGFMYLTKEDVWLSAGLSVLFTSLYSILDSPDDPNAQLGHIGAATLINVGVSIPLFNSRKPYRVLKRNR